MANPLENEQEAFYYQYEMVYSIYKEYFQIVPDLRPKICYTFFLPEFCKGAGYIIYYLVAFLLTGSSFLTFVFHCRRSIKSSTTRFYFYTSISLILYYLPELIYMRPTAPLIFGQFGVIIGFCAAALFSRDCFYLLKSFGHRFEALIVFALNIFLVILAIMSIITTFTLHFAPELSFNQFANYFLTYSAVCVDSILAIELFLSFFQNHNYISLLDRTAKIVLGICNVIFALQGMMEFAYVQFVLHTHIDLAPLNVILAVHESDFDKHIGSYMYWNRYVLGQFELIRIGVLMITLAVITKVYESYFQDDASSDDIRSSFIDEELIPTI